MGDFNRMNEWFGPGWNPESDADSGEETSLEPFTYRMHFPEAPDQVLQTVKVVQGRLVVSIEFVFDDVDILESDED